MKAVVLHGVRKLEVKEVIPPIPPQGWALVKTELVGICGTDKAFYVGSYRMHKSPLIPGHEVVGRVVEGPDWLIEKRVVPEINFPCRGCDYCRRGLYTHCPNRRTLGIDFDGGMAEYFIAPVDALHLFEGSPEKGIFVEPLAAALRALNLRPIKSGGRAAVIGTGNLAWLITQVLRRLCGASVDVIAKRGSTKAAYFKSVANVVYHNEVIDSSYDAVFEASGDPSALDLAIKIAKPRCVVHLKSTHSAPTQINATSAVVKEVEIIGSRCGTFLEFKSAIELLIRGTVEPMLNKIYALDDAEGAFEDSLEKSYLKVALRPGV